jgi:DNA replication protein DnaC
MINSLIDKLGVAEIGERKFILGANKPTPIKCNFCGKELEYVQAGEGMFIAWKTPNKCDCKKALDYWKRFKEEEKRIKAEVEEFKEKEIRKTEVEKLIDRSNLGRRFKDRTFKTFKVTKENETALKKAYDYAVNFNDYESKGKGLLFIGQVGTGKTHLTAAIANYLMFEKIIPVKFGNVTTLLGEIKNSYNDEESASESDLIYMLSNVRLLIIDDLGKEKCTEWSNNIIYTIINNRYENYKPTIVTTNLSIKELENQIGDASVSRLIEMCDGVKMDGFDFRKTKLT